MKPSVEKENLGSPAALTLLMAVKKNGLKNKWLIAQATLVIGFVLQAGMAAAQNLVTNPGFETGNTSGWFAFGSPTTALAFLRTPSSASSICYSVWTRVTTGRAWA